jgi:hypothetical protein
VLSSLFVVIPNNKGDLTRHAAQVPDEDLLRTGHLYEPSHRGVSGRYIAAGNFPSRLLTARQPRYKYTNFDIQSIVPQLVAPSCCYIIEEAPRLLFAANTFSRRLLPS